MNFLKMIVLTAVVVFLFSGFNGTQKKYLPVCVQFSDSTLNNSELMLNIKAAFGNKKIKTISKDDAIVYIKAEATRVGEDYHRMGGNLGNWEQLKTYMISNTRYVANMLQIKIKLNSNGNIEDTVSWNNHGVPINFGNFPKKNPKYMVLDSLNSTSLLRLSQSLVDSIIASNILEKE